MTKIIDGKNVAAIIKDELKNQIFDFKNKGGSVGLAVVLVGDDAASKVYVNNKIKACEYVGIKSESYCLPDSATQRQVEDLIDALAENKNINGILVQLPLPKHLDKYKILSKIPAKKDVDGFTAENVANLVLNKDCFVPCTPLGVIELLKYENIEISGKNAVVIGRSDIVGKPMAMLLLHENATVTICHSKTRNLTEICKKADIIVAAIGSPNFLKGEMVKSGAVVVDVGINRVCGKLIGDVDFESVSKKTSYITPVPGGVGPMTITMLLKNTFKSALAEFKIV